MGIGVDGSLYERISSGSQIEVHDDLSMTVA
jgi:hypothetical protein